MLEKAWQNHTTSHPHGVCEAACVTWLRRITEQGIGHANEIRPEECDPLQARVEAGDFMWTMQLREEIPSAAINPFEESRRYTKPGHFTQAGNTEAVLGTMAPQEFCFLAANRPNGGAAHALAIYNGGDRYWFFDPDAGIFTGPPHEVAAHVVERLSTYKEVGGTIGSLG